MKFPKFNDTQYLAPDKLFPTDRFIERFFLWMIPAWVTPNHITLFRMIATPFTIALLYDQHYALGVPVFLFVAFTDALDGALARTKKMITPWGMMFDPLADKLLVIPSLLVLMFSHLNPVLALSSIGIEVLIIVLALMWKRAGKTIQANTWGKIKMFLQVVGILLLLIGARFSSDELLFGATILIATSIFFGVVSILRHGI